jgi:beta-glucosidase-like glycosyl hydrolase
MAKPLRNSATDGHQVNYAPVVDVNNNPDNPVINDRSFGEDPRRVAIWAYNI